MKFIPEGLAQLQRKIAWLLLFTFSSLCFVGWLIYSNKNHLESAAFRATHIYSVLVTGSLFAFLFVVIILFRLNKDIVLRKMAEQQLLQSELKYRGLIENAGAVIYSADQEGYINFASARATQLTGYSPEDLQGKHFSMFVAPACLEMVASHYANQAAARIAETTLTFLTLTRDGTLKWVEQFAVLLQENNEPTGFQCIVKDISENKLMQLELEKSEFRLKENQAWLQSILDNTDSLIYIKDLHGRYIMVNRQFQESLQVKDQEVVGRTDYDYSNQEAADHYRSLDEEVIRTGKSLQIEEVLPGVDGQRHLLSTKFPLLDANGRPFGIGGIATDITERVHYQQQLVAATKEAQEAKGLQEQFLANMSHEIRTPMNGIQGMTDLLLDTSLSEQQKEFAVIIKRSVNNLLVIINDILDFSKIKAGKLAIEKIDFNLRDILDNTKAIFEHRIKKKSLQFQMTVDPAIPTTLKGDPYRLNQVLTNLIGNAIKFTEQGCINIKARLLECKDDRVELEFSVEDTGIGIADSDLPHIFENFSQAGMDIARRYGGTGLGLAICHQLMQMQGGDISVASEKGQGSVFRCRISYGYTGSQEVSAPVAVTIADFGQCLAGRRFLVAEDNEVNQKLVDHVLKKGGGEVKLTNNGDEAVQMLRDGNEYDIIIMDLQMPVMDGYAATRYIRRELKLSTPIIAMTATALVGEQVRCLEAGMNAYMTKPFEFVELYKRITALLDRPWMSAPHRTGMENGKDYDLGLLRQMEDPQYLLDTLHAFLTVTCGQLEEMAEAGERRDFDRVFSLSHLVRGRAGVLQVQELLELLGEIEQQARLKMDAGVLIQRALDVYAQLRPSLQLEKDQLGFRETFLKTTS